MIISTSIQKFILLSKQRMADMFVQCVEMAQGKAALESNSSKDSLSDINALNVERVEM